MDNTKTKICTKCKKEISINEFGKDKKTPDKLSYTCNSCRKEYYDKNKEHIREYSRKYHTKNRETINKKYTDKYSKNPEKYREESKKYYHNNKEKVRVYRRKWSKNNNQRKKYMKNYLRAYIRDRMKTDVDFRIMHLLRRRILHAINDNYKSATTSNLVGCNINKLKHHLQISALNNGYENFDIENYNGTEYHIDHIKPCASFDLTKEEEQMKCFNYKNLQILTAEENLLKGDKYEEN